MKCKYCNKQVDVLSVYVNYCSGECRKKDLNYMEFNKDFRDLIFHCNTEYGLHKVLVSNKQRLWTEFSQNQYNNKYKGE